MKKELIELRVNGRGREVAIPPNKLLLDVLREDLDLTGSKRGCDDSSCGACTVQVNGVPVLACTVLAASVSGDEHEILTIEGIVQHGALDAIQKAYGDWGGAQCGFCTPGFLMLMTAVLKREPDISDDDILDVLASNLCRCTGYQNIVKAVRVAAAEMRVT
jgi:carbon-monoxide dehydrogenase small subunit